MPVRPRIDGGLVVLHSGTVTTCNYEGRGMGRRRGGRWIWVPASKRKMWSADQLMLPLNGLLAVPKKRRERRRECSTLDVPF